MQIAILGYSVLAFIAGLLLLVTSSMGINRSIECEQYKKSNKNNDTWLTIMIVVSVLMILGSGIGFYLSIKKDLNASSQQLDSPITVDVSPDNSPFTPNVSRAVRAAMTIRSYEDMPPPSGIIGKPDVSPVPSVITPVTPNVSSVPSGITPTITNILGDPNTIKNINSLIRAAANSYEDLPPPSGIIGKQIEF